MTHSSLNKLNFFPEELIHAKAEQLHLHLKGPSLFYLEGKRNPPLFLSLLLHGNEHSSILAFQRFIAKYKNQLPRSAYVFIGNTEAAQFNKRKLDHQEDFNRIWSADCRESEEKKIAQEVLQLIENKELFASVDIHNNTGKNPHYACLSNLAPEFIHLARLFSRTLVYFTQPHSTQSVVFSPKTPAITIECGLSAEETGVQKVYQFLEDLFHLSHFPTKPLGNHEIDCYETFAKLSIPAEIQFEFGKHFSHEKNSLLLRPDLDSLNFSELAAGECLGNYRNEARILFQDADGGELNHSLLHYKDSQILLSSPVIPSMFTLNEKVIRQDCLGYLMRRKKIG